MYLYLSGKQKQNDMKTQKQVVRILGQEVTVGTKLHAKLVQQVKLFNQLSVSETKHF